MILSSGVFNRHNKIVSLILLSRKTRYLENELNPVKIKNIAPIIELMLVLYTSEIIIFVLEISYKKLESFTTKRRFTQRNDNAKKRAGL